MYTLHIADSSWSLQLYRTFYGTEKCVVCDRTQWNSVTDINNVFALTKGLVSNFHLK